MRKMFIKWKFGLKWFCTACQKPLISKEDCFVVEKKDLKLPNSLLISENRLLKILRELIKKVKFLMTFPFFKIKRVIEVALVLKIESCLKVIWMMIWFINRSMR